MAGTEYRPSLDELERDEKLQRAARLSCVAPLVAILLNWAGGLSGSRAMMIITLTLALSFIVLGFGAAIWALRKRKGLPTPNVATPATLGLVLNGMILFMLFALSISIFSGTLDQ